MTSKLPPDSPPLDTREPSRPGETISDSEVPELEDPAEVVQAKVGRIARDRKAKSGRTPSTEG